jgi:hypothetical protein
VGPSPNGKPTTFPHRTWSMKCLTEPLSYHHFIPLFLIKTWAVPPKTPHHHHWHHSMDDDLSQPPPLLHCNDVVFLFGFPFPGALNEHNHLFSSTTDHPRLLNPFLSFFRFPASDTLRSMRWAMPREVLIIICSPSQGGGVAAPTFSSRGSWGGRRGRQVGRCRGRV